MGSKRKGRRREGDEMRLSKIRGPGGAYALNPCSPYVLTALAYIATPLHCDHVYKEKKK